MTFLLLVVGALFGAVALGFPGFVLGAGLGYGIALLLEMRRRLDRLERTMEARKRRIAAEAAAARLSDSHPPPQPSVSASPVSTAVPQSLRYPEEDLIDALRQAEEDPEARGAETEDILRQVEPVSNLSPLTQISRQT